MMDQPSARAASTLWIVLLTAASLLATFALACMTPFSALAALAAVHMRRRDGIALMLAAWVVNQGVGFVALHYPTDPTTIAWGLFIGAAAVAAVLAGGWAAACVRSYPLQLALAFAIGFVAFKAMLVVAALFLGDMKVSLSLVIAGPQFVREGAIALALLAVYRVLVAIGVPAAPGRTLARA